MDDPEVKERIRSEVDIVEVVGRCIPLKRNGVRYWAPCPFHREKTPSFQVNQTRQTFYCFGCQKGGDVFAFLMEYERLTFPEALERLARQVGITLGRTKLDPELRLAKDRILQLHEDLTGHWHRRLLDGEEGKEGRDYLEKREVDREVVRSFRLGWASRSWEGIGKWGSDHGYDERILEKAGLLVRKEDNGSGPYARFRGRLIFPIRDIQQRVIAFSGRLVREEDKGGKYINSPDTPIFLKSKVLFGLDLANRAALEAGRMIVCEGQLDVIACHQAGIRNVVAPMGTALTEIHAGQLMRYVSEVVLCLDSDMAGWEAVRRGYQVLIDREMAVRVGVLPEGHDPDSYIRENGADAFRDRIGESIGYHDFLLNHLIGVHGCRDQAAVHTVIEGMRDAAYRVKDAAVRDRLAQRVAGVLQVSLDAIRRDFVSRSETTRSREIGQEAGSTEEPVELPDIHEKALLELVLWHPEAEWVDWLFQHLDMEWIRNEVVRVTLEDRMECQARGCPFEPRRVLDLLDDEPQLRSFVAGIVTRERKVDNARRQLEDILKSLRRRHLEEELTRIRSRIHQSDGGSVDHEEYLALRQMARQGLEPLADT